MKTFKNLLSEKRNQKKTVLDDKTVFYIFKKIIQAEFGNIGSHKFIPDYFSNKILFIKSESSAWKAELWLNRNKIIRKINQEIGQEEIKEIKIK